MGEIKCKHCPVVFWLLLLWSLTIKLQTRNEITIKLNVLTWEVIFKFIITCTCNLWALNIEKHVSMCNYSNKAKLPDASCYIVTAEVCTVNEAVEPDKPKEDIRQEEFTLPSGFIWDALNIDEPSQVLRCSNFFFQFFLLWIFWWPWTVQLLILFCSSLTLHFILLTAWPSILPSVCGFALLSTHPFLPS